MNLILLVTLCEPIPHSLGFSACDDLTPYSWNITDDSSRLTALNECSILSNAYDKLAGVKQTDCYIEAVEDNLK